MTWFGYTLAVLVIAACLAVVAIGLIPDKPNGDGQ